MTDAIVLAGGFSNRLKWDTNVCKPLLKIGKQSLLSLQTKWLLSKGFQKIHLVVSQDVIDGIDEWILESKAKPMISIFVEKERRGTAGAISNVLANIEGKIFYVCNVDDLVLESEPMHMILKAEKFPAVLLAAKPRITFGMLKTRGELVLGFKEKPLADYYVSCGHYAFNVDRLNNGLNFPREGNLEETLLPELAQRRKLCFEKYKGCWQTVSTYKDYLEICEKV